MAEEGPLTAAQIYEQINGGSGTGHLDEARDATHSLRAQLLESAQLVGELAKQIQDGWTGEAGNTAANAAGPLAKAALEDADLLSEADLAVTSQASAFYTVKNSVVPVAPDKPELTSADVLDAVVTGNWHGYTDKVGEWQAQSQQNIDAFAGYHSSSMDNGDTMPSSFAPLVDPGAPVSLADPVAGDKAEKGHTPTTPPSGSQPNSFDGGQPKVTGGAQPEPGGPSHVVPPQAQTQNAQPASGIQDGTKAASHTPTADPKTPAAKPFAPTSSGPPMGNSPGTPASFGGAYRTGGGFSSGSGGSGSGGKPGNTVARPGVPGNVPAPGRPVGGGTGEAAATRGATTGKPGVTPVGGAVPGASRGEEDEEHQRPAYLLGPDPEELFGGDTEKPVPPVIGETPQPR
ncbi:hypothetical protein ACPZ19_03195 [Amycolatopsis lurida]